MKLGLIINNIPIIPTMALMNSNLPYGSFSINLASIPVQIMDKKIRVVASDNGIILID